jgi:hypothetical protein
MNNVLLNALSTQSLGKLWQQLTLFELPTGTVLHKYGEPMRIIYFPETAVLSMLSVSLEGRTIGSAIIGRDGCVGYPFALTSGQCHSVL